MEKFDRNLYVDCAKAFADDIEAMAGDVDPDLAKVSAWAMVSIANSLAVIADVLVNGEPYVNTGPK